MSTRGIPPVNGREEVKPGWLDRALEQAFGEDAPACLLCGDDGVVELVPVKPGRRVNGVGIVSCPHPRPSWAVRWRQDVPAVGGS